MTYELRALVAPLGALIPWAQVVGERPVELAQGFGLMPITNAAFDRLGGRGRVPGRAGFWYLSQPVEAVAVEISRSAPVAYLEANYFGGVGDQASIVWLGRQIVLGPLHQDMGGKAPELGPSWGQPINAALRQIGVGEGPGQDEFERLGLGWRDSTELWSHPAVL